MKSHTLLPLLTLGAGVVVLVGACGDGSQDTTLSAYAAEVQQTLSEMDAAERRHHEAVRSSADPDDIRAEEARYAEEMHRHWDTLDGVTTGLEECGPVGMMGHHEDMEAHMRDFHDGVHAMDGEFGSHWDTMRQLADVDALHAEEDAHHRDWQEMRDWMDAHHEAFRSEGGEWDCPALNDSDVQQGHHHGDGDHHMGEDWGGHMDGGWGGHMGGGWDGHMDGGWGGHMDGGGR